MVQDLVKPALVGFLYGLALSAIGFLMTGAGHGTYILLGVASAPLSFFGFYVSLAGPPVLWTAIGSRLPYRRQPQRRLVATVMLLHYLGVLLIPFFDQYAQWKNLERAWAENPGMVLAGLGLYCVGQITIWFYWFKIGRTRPNG